MDFYDPSAVENEEDEDSFGKDVCPSRGLGCGLCLLGLLFHSGHTSVQGHEQLRENIIFLVDSSPAMNEKAQGELPQVIH